MKLNTTREIFEKDLNKLGFRIKFQDDESFLRTQKSINSSIYENVITIIANRFIDRLSRVFQPGMQDMALFSKDGLTEVKDSYFVKAFKSNMGILPELRNFPEDELNLINFTKCKNPELTKFVFFYHGFNYSHIIDLDRDQNIFYRSIKDMCSDTISRNLEKELYLSEALIKYIYGATQDELTSDLN